MKVTPDNFTQMFPQYIRFISDCKEKVHHKETYCESHHVLPRSWGGADGEVVRLSYYDHVRAHYLIADEAGNNGTSQKQTRQMLCAFNRMISHDNYAELDWSESEVQEHVLMRDAWRKNHHWKFNRKGIRHTAERCANISKARKGATFSAEWRANLSKAAKNRLPASEHARTNMAMAQKAAWARRRAAAGEGGVKHTAQSRANMSAAQKAREPHSAQTRAKMSAAAKARKQRPVSAKTREKMSKARTGVKRGPFSAEHCANISKSKKGKKLGPFSDAHREKLSIAQQKRWAKKRQEEAAAMA